MTVPLAVFNVPLAVNELYVTLVELLVVTAGANVGQGGQLDI